MLVLLIVILISCSTKEDKVNIVKKVDNKTGDIILKYVYPNDSSKNYTIVYDSACRMKFKLFYLGNDIYKYVEYEKNKENKEICITSYELLSNKNSILYQWIFIEGNTLDLKRSEFAYTYIDEDKRNNEYTLGVIYYTPLYPERKYIKIGYGKHFETKTNIKIDTYYFDKEQILTKKYMPYYIPCFFYKKIKLNRKDVENGVIRGKIESYVYHGDNPKTGDSTFLLYTKYFANKITFKE